MIAQRTESHQLFSYSKCISAAGVVFTHLSLPAYADPPAGELASGTSNDTIPAFVQLGVMGADVVPYISQSKERLTAELQSRERAKKKEISLKYLDNK